MTFATLTMIAMWQRLPQHRVVSASVPGYGHDEVVVHGPGLLSGLTSDSSAQAPTAIVSRHHHGAHGGVDPDIIATEPHGSPPPAPPPAPPRSFASTAGRRECVQRKIYRAFGYDHIPSFFVPGCDHRALWDFAGWAGHEGCGTEPVPGPDLMLVHSAWCVACGFTPGPLVLSPSPRSRLVLHLCMHIPNPDAPCTNASIIVRPPAEAHPCVIFWPQPERWARGPW